MDAEAEQQTYGGGGDTAEACASTLALAAVLELCAHVSDRSSPARAAEPAGRGLVAPCDKDDGGSSWRPDSP
jgi:hypothetical protein